VATISARIDEQLKNEAEQIAESIGLSLSTVINVFLKRFTAERGFPFNVIDPKTTTNAPFLNLNDLDQCINRAISCPSFKAPAEHITFIDPTTNELTTKTIGVD